MKRWIWFLVSIIISTGVYFTLRYGLRPKPIPVLNATEFSEAQQIGAVIYKRLRQEIRGERVLLLGSTPEMQEYEQVWTGLLKTAVADQVKISVLFQHEGLKIPALEGAWETIPYSDQMIQSGELLAMVKTHLQSGKLVVIHGASTEVSHLMKASLSRILDGELGRPVLALSTLSLSLKPEEQSSLQAQCMSSENDSQMRIECAEARVSKILTKKKPAEGKLWAVMERHGLKEYLIFIHR
ncbi:MAG: hypothetical protein ACXVA9_10800 [Bdellovibrionales bacterium]